jgi:hypothetical protein
MKSERTFDMYHGSHRWFGPPEIKPLRIGHAEHGPGIYFTTSRGTAGDYAKGGGKIGRFTLTQPRAWAHEVCLDRGDLRHIFSKIPRMKMRDKVLGWAEESLSERHLTGQVLINLFVNANVAHGLPGVVLAAGLVELGADASFALDRREEKWVIVLNPLMVKRRRDATADDPWSLPVEKNVFLSFAGEAKT